MQHLTIQNGSVQTVWYGRAESGKAEGAGIDVSTSTSTTYIPGSPSRNAIV